MLGEIFTAVFKAVAMLSLAIIGIFCVCYGYDAVATNVDRLLGFVLFAVGGVFIGFSFLVGFNRKKYL